jgi:putative FmdB family regulatory protein
MPTYDYRCAACKHQFEVFQSMRERAKRKCPRCGRSALERLIGTGAAVLFKGSGFYQTDYRSESYRKAAEADKPASDKPAAGAAPSTDTKPSDTKPSADTKKPGAGSKSRRRAEP